MDQHDMRFLYNRAYEQPFIRQLLVTCETAEDFKNTWFESEDPIIKRLYREVDSAGFAHFIAVMMHGRYIMSGREYTPRYQYPTAYLNVEHARSVLIGG